MTDTRQFEFGGYMLDPVRRLLFDAKGATLPLSSRAFDTLLHFLENPGALHTKQALMKAIWPNSIVEENNLNQSILALRRALGESPGDHRFIVTVTGRGYRFVAPVQVREVPSRAAQLLPVMRQTGFATVSGMSLDDEGTRTRAVDDSQSERVGPRGWWITRLLAPALCLAVLLFVQFAEPPTSAPAAAPISVAVLPFVDLSADRAEQFLADGIASELLMWLADEPGLKVVSRTASFAMGSRAQDLRSIGRALGADHVLEGSIRAAGRRLRISVQLIDTDSGVRLWAQTYDRKLGDTVPLQDELARTIATEVAAALGPGGDERQNPERR